MLPTLLLSATALLASQSARAAPDAEYWAPSGEPFCEIEEQAFDPLASHATGTEAPAGGAWWLQRQTAFFTEDPLLDDPDRLELVAGDGTVLERDLHVTASALALRVPEGAAPGSTFLLRDRLDPSFGRVLQVGAQADRQARRTNIALELVAPRLAECFADCDDGVAYDVPAAPRFTLSFEGAPVIVDAWHRRPGDLGDLGDEATDAVLLALPRQLDSRLVPDGGPRQLEADLLRDVLGSHLHVELRDPLTLELVFEQDLSLDEVPTVFNSEDLPTCAPIDEQYPYDYDTGGGCSSAGGAAPGALALLLAGLLARRRRR
jgi:MYXO-CTERM domain-containing protein